MSGGSISQRKLAANRANAQLSTGPHTAHGKARSSRNALKHGLLSSQVALDTEDLQVLDCLRENLAAQLSPVGILEELFVDRIAVGFWRLRRSIQVESALMEDRHRERMEAVYQELRLPTRMGDSQDHDTGRLLERREARRPRLALIHMIDNESLERIHRYETTIERQTYRALHELQRLQTARQSAMPLVPVAFDVDVTGNGPSPQ
jgi:hypothetical protein